MHPEPDPVGKGQESVWNYPRPAIGEPTDRHVEIRHHGTILVDTVRAWRTLETSHPPTYYIPPDDIAMEHLVPNSRRSICEWKGQARYWDVVIDGIRLEAVGWSYPDPTRAFAGMAGYFAFYPEPFDECLLDGEQVTPQPGGFYGGWISAREAGPFKGVPGSRLW
ncbi:DUF427 domain-containing protein [Qipengyuania spongiae]|uniref:DUF427 domain-containing protein n=1 Tax=Qipengyuania spongiae TaxID=2909673 RepID=A0ABY5T1A8_9SPHN|nr:DUF427 domain-containing protein [Qipengyuania spongiae]UVI40558.1 DUF427 domain-containing protein [Qipengyuania spongiae]